MNIYRLLRHLKSLAPTVLAALLVAITITVIAKPAVTARAEAGQAFSISPSLIELSANPGDAVKATVKFTNISQGELLVKTQFNDFGAKNETGDPNIIFDDTDNSTHSLRTWIGTPQPFLIKSKEAKTIDFTINVPKNAEPGGHYAVIRFSGNAPELEQTGVALTASVGSLVLLTVSGDIQEKASVAEFYSATADFSKRSFFETGPVSLVERVKNDGNVHLKPTGMVTVKDMFGHVISSSRVNGTAGDPKDGPRSILPKSIRRFEQTFGANQLLFGRYEATMDLQYGSKGTKISSTTVFWVIPYTLIAIVLVGLIALGFFGRTALRRYNEHIIKSARKRR